MTSNTKLPSSDLSLSIYKILIPPDFLLDFDVHTVEELPTEWRITLHEKEERVPTILVGKDYVSDGFCNSIDILSHAFSMKKIYLRLVRRRWKLRGEAKHYSNEYDLHPQGMKTTRLFRDFLKDIIG
jgi:hypothetical protein